jgi:hypothetical protein
MLAGQTKLKGKGNYLWQVKLWLTGCSHSRKVYYPVED